MTLPDLWVERIEAIARREGRTVEEVLNSLLEDYEPQQNVADSIEDFIGVFDDDVTDLSVSVRQTLRQRFGYHDDGAV
jgi:hypothetical protein